MSHHFQPDPDVPDYCRCGNHKAHPEHSPEDVDRKQIGLSYDDLCYLSQVFNYGCDLSQSRDSRINEWLKDQLTEAFIEAATVSTETRTMMQSAKSQRQAIQESFKMDLDIEVARAMGVRVEKYPKHNADHAWLANPANYPHIEVCELEPKQIIFWAKPGSSGEDWSPSTDLKAAVAMVLAAEQAWEERS